MVYERAVEPLLVYVNPKFASSEVTNDKVNPEVELPVNVKREMLGAVLSKLNQVQVTRPVFPARSANASEYETTP